MKSNPQEQEEPMDSASLDEGEASPAGRVVVLRVPEYGLARQVASRAGFFSPVIKAALESSSDDDDKMEVIIPARLVPDDRVLDLLVEYLQTVAAPGSTVDDKWIKGHFPPNEPELATAELLLADWLGLDGLVAALGPVVVNTEQRRYQTQDFEWKRQRQRCLDAAASVGLLHYRDWREFRASPDKVAGAKDKGVLDRLRECAVLYQCPDSDGYACLADRPPRSWRPSDQRARQARVFDLVRPALAKWDVRSFGAENEAAADAWCRAAPSAADAQPYDYERTYKKGQVVYVPEEVDEPSNGPVYYQSLTNDNAKQELFVAGGRGAWERIFPWADELAWAYCLQHAPATAGQHVAEWAPSLLKYLGVRDPGLDVSGRGWLVDLQLEIACSGEPVLTVTRHPGEAGKYHIPGSATAVSADEAARWLSAIVRDADLEKRACRARVVGRGKPLPWTDELLGEARMWLLLRRLLPPDLRLRPYLELRLPRQELERYQNKYGTKWWPVLEQSLGKEGALLAVPLSEVFSDWFTWFAGFFPDARASAQVVLSTRDLPLTPEAAAAARGNVELVEDFFDRAYPFAVEQHEMDLDFLQKLRDELAAARRASGDDPVQLKAQTEEAEAQRLRVEADLEQASSSSPPGPAGDVVPDEASQWYRQLKEQTRRSDASKVGSRETWDDESRSYLDPANSALSQAQQVLARQRAVEQQFREQFPGARSVFDVPGLEALAERVRSERLASFRRQQLQAELEAARRQERRLQAQYEAAASRPGADVFEALARQIELARERASAFPSASPDEDED